MSPKSVNSVGARVAEARRARGLSQLALAKAVGIDRSAISKIEGGRRRIGSLELARIARCLDRPLEWFLTDRDDDVVRDVRKLRRAILRIAARHGARTVRVFGSVARRDAQRDSDVDLLVEMEHGRTLFDQAAMLVEIRDLIGRDVDVVTEEGLRGSIRDRVLRDAVPL